MEYITLTAPDSGDTITLYIVEETKVNEQKYLLATEDADGDTDAYLLKEVASDDADATYEFVEDDVEFESVVKIFSELVDEDVKLQV